MFRRIGASALHLGAGSRNNTIARCTFVDVSGSALVLGGIADAREPEPRNWTAGNVLRDSTISHVGVEYAGSPGVSVGWAVDTTIAFCEIANLSYSGANSL